MSTSLLEQAEKSLYVRLLKYAFEHESEGKNIDKEKAAGVLGVASSELDRFYARVFQQDKRSGGARMLPDAFVAYLEFLEAKASEDRIKQAETQFTKTIAKMNQRIAQAENHSRTATNIATKAVRVATWAVFVTVLFALVSIGLSVWQINKPVKLDETQLNQLGELGQKPEEEFGLSEDQRKQAFKEIVDAERKAAKEAMEREPSDIDAQIDLEGELAKEYKNELAEKYNLTRDQLDAVSLDGVGKPLN